MHRIENTRNLADIARQFKFKYDDTDSIEITQDKNDDSDSDYTPEAMNPSSTYGQHLL
jgi:hypothetical protein